MMNPTEMTEKASEIMTPLAKLFRQRLCDFYLEGKEKDGVNGKELILFFSGMLSGFVQTEIDCMSEASGVPEEVFFKFDYENVIRCS